MISRIVVPLDGSEVAEAVLPWVRDLALGLHAKVHFVQVVDLKTELLASEVGARTARDPSAVATQLEKDTKAAEDYLSGLATAWQAEDIEAKWEVVRGSPATSIIDFAHAHEADIIAMSTHGRSGLGRLLFGSVADQVLREAGTPVLLVKPGRKKTRTSQPPASP